MNMENDLGRDDIRSLVFRIAIPSMLGQFVSVLYSIVDRMYVGHIAGVGELALAGVGVCGPVVTMVGSVAFLVGVGGAPLMSIRMGEGRSDRAGEILRNCFWMLLAFAAILTAGILPLRQPMLRLFGASGATYPYADRYFTIYLCGTVFALLSSGLNQFVICQGFARAGMAAVVLGAVLNIVLDPVFIFLLDLDVAGAALATVLSQAGSAAFLLCFLLSGRVPVRLTFRGWNPRLMGRVLVQGLTPFLIIAVDNVMIIAMNAVLQRYGGAARGDLLVTCNTIVQSFMLVITMPLGGISGGTQSILGYNYGACQTDRVLKAQRYIAGLCMGFTAVMFVLARLAGPLFVGLFTDQPELAALAQRAIGICTLAIVPLGLQYAIVDGFTGMGQVQVSLPLSAWRKLVYFAAVFTLPALWGADAAFYAEPISDVLGIAVSVAVYLLCIRRLLRRRVEQVRRAAARRAD